ncbi:HD domain-containing protein [Halobacillus karajensis]|uniref:Bifunctional (P)ppGpp synthase/hydrolase RelA n=1 Tax=Halobacillus karajensis TaxID=195088 RepID=A0A024P8C6_9BACI|nr:HD domain-containing protein [Halobacillus karajensis]CDQ21434.1 Bifunctional (p)ppGpp synthase/hydrolase RelA [Halobacillus karajensis]CDQ25369.1 Bifunctional (p)ppGpp synthase/hydrolase RelA [Halobacillus karajensis]CDQ29693.1 Bifunctional (p)ppGpp synthase/hydrolase RelA [Halobacillus karajensis]SEI07570.1 HD domain-containing protein [Halobacillus karajensis]
MIDKAKLFATKAHCGQKRKNADEDYIVHPVRVAETLKQAGFHDVLICAGYLHDVAEDTAYTLDDIEKEFGFDVRQLVAAHTEDKSKAWQERKQQTIHTVHEASFDVKSLIVADKLDNLESLQKEIQTHGNEVWKKFNAGYDWQKWYNQSIAEAMTNGLRSEQIPHYFKRYKQLVKQTFD